MSLFADHMILYIENRDVMHSTKTIVNTNVQRKIKLKSEFSTGKSKQDD